MVKTRHKQALTRKLVIALTKQKQKLENCSKKGKSSSDKKIFIKKFTKT